MGKRLKKFIVWALAVAMLVGVIYVPEMKAEAATKTTIKVKNLPANVLVLKKGKSFTLKVSAKTGKKKAKVTYTSSKPGVVTVSAKGKIKAVKKGTSTVTIASAANPNYKKKIKVTVGTPAKSVKLDAASKTLVTGQSFKLKATVLTKKAKYRQVVWKTSNAAVCKVDTKGNVKALKAGTAKITAVAKDGSGKKKTCTVTVVDPVKIVSAKYNLFGGEYITFTLNRVYKLTKANITVNSKQYAWGKYAGQNKIAGIFTNDNKTYKVSFTTYNSFYTNGYAKITLNNVPGGTTFKEIIINNYDRYKESQEVVSYSKLGEYTRIYANLPGYNQTFGVTATGVPQGMRVEVSNSNMYLEGIPEKVGIYNIVAKCVSELGDEITVNMKFAVYDDEHSYAMAKTAYYCFTEGSSIPVTNSLIVASSKSLTYEIVGEDHGLTLSGKQFSGTFDKAGTYNVKVRVKEAQTGKEVGVVTQKYVVKMARKIKVKILDALGDDIEDAYGYFSIDSYYSDGITSHASTSESDGERYATLTPGKYYAEVSLYSMEEYESNIVVDENTTEVVIKTDFCPVTIEKPSDLHDSNSSYGSWRDEKNDYLGYGSKIYVRPGSYVLNSYIYDFSIEHKATATFNITKSATVKPVFDTGTTNVHEIITIGKTLNNKGAYRYVVKFVAPETRSYDLTAVGSDCKLYYADEESISYKLISNKNTGSVSLTKGKVYYLIFESYNSKDFDINVSIK